MSADDDDARATELDGPGAVVSHAEALAAHRRGVTRPVAVAADLSVSPATAGRLLRNLRGAGLIP